VAMGPRRRQPEENQAGKPCMRRAIGPSRWLVWSR
jgi:hypothetical protein